MAYENNSGPDDIFERRESRVRSYCRAFPDLFRSARGAEMVADDGRYYIDFLSGCSTLNYGHNHPELKRALIEYISADGVAHGLDMHTEAKARFLEALERYVLVPRKMDYCAMFPGPTGANAVEAAIKIARKVTGRTNIVAFTNGFHGMTLGALSLTGNSGKREGAGIPLTGVSHEPYCGYFGDEADTADQLDQRLSDPSSGIDKPAAIIAETVQGEGGLNVASDVWLRQIERIAHKHGALLIIDDIQAGIGRAGGFFSFERAGIRPDIVTLAKSLSGFGLPLALTLIRPQYDQWKPGEHNGTFRGNNHAFVTAARALELFWADNTFELEIARKAARLRSALKEIAESSPFASHVKGRGMMTGIEMRSGDIASEICGECFKNGLIIETSGGQGEVVKVLAPLNIPDSELDAGLAVLADAARAVAARHKKSVA
ncbi:MAG: diaminobutyrate--2-oxoglutarate transaminase [Hyphomonas sp.]|uniref:diaminobutyrate--2-oxoglutarate transaminase n=1 Tax=Hyphomonas sp. TaxID=87 RepID=UPI001843F6D0|nr:diaminobutyrate--2-oxoglutarate transaminase [Hyphomonas sp.]MBA3069222.1 diaminobutyrate--2-oxoglutarate transaminase [Hyphomonas sp.]MBU3920567.1 diaminobutyrate--2-oxoglutarate transaminase [Alphaproteobacteria bacterium]MBU4061831.1 diaminobutyrate--2-oxoglutarate transaminase [Alphaproteobacteria bacterium]MBU4163337.1 diaminobutyrate--2-oxoglutarate transaminase [Alphaproteobacteria bacterium]